jgi:hypothetical protein
MIFCYYFFHVFSSLIEISKLNAGGTIIFWNLTFTPSYADLLCGGLHLVRAGVVVESLGPQGNTP